LLFAMMDHKCICIAGERGRVFITEDTVKPGWHRNRPCMMKRRDREGSCTPLQMITATFYAVGIDSAYIYSKDYGKTWTEGNNWFY